MDFSQAILEIKKGKKITRKGWNGKGMYLWLLPESIVKKEWVKDPNLLEAMGNNDSIKCLGSIRMKTADGSVLTGWLASQSDVLADDWMVYQN